MVVVTTVRNPVRVKIIVEKLVMASIRSGLRVTDSC